jgi:YjbE family integral membrane protein
MKQDFAFTWGYAWGYSWGYAWQILEIVWINLLLSGDNAILIALACRELPPRQRRMGVFLGSLCGLALRIVFTLLLVEILSAPMLKTAAGLLLIVIALKLATERGDLAAVEAKPRFWSAVLSIVAADTAMSLDNVVAVAAAAEGSFRLVVFGLALSAPILMFGATAALRVLDRFPLLIWAGAGLLGWIAGGLIASDAYWMRFARFEHPVSGVALSVGAVLLVLLIALVIELMEGWARR